MKLSVVLIVLVVVGFGIFYAVTFSSKQTPLEQKTMVQTSIADVSPTDSVPITSPTPVNYQASFSIFTNGTFRIFTASMYHNVSEDVYLTSANPNIIHIKKTGVTWDDFFKTLPFSLTKECLTTGTGQTFCSTASHRLRFYLNEQFDPNALDKVIQPGDRLLVSYGNEDESIIQQQLQQIPVVK